MKQVLLRVTALTLLSWFSHPAIAQVTAEWTGGAIWTYSYSGVARTGATAIKKLLGTSGNGYTEVTATLSTTGNWTTTRFWIEDGIKYGTGLRLDFSGDLSMPTNGSVICFQVTFETPDISLPATVSYYSSMSGGLNSYSCPEIVTIAPQVTDAFQVNASDGAFADRVRITWNEQETATDYEVYRCTTGSESDCGTALGSSSGNGFNDTVGELDTVYYYRVKACAGGLCGDFSLADAGQRSITYDDHGNACEEATLVEVDSTTAGEIETGGDVDYFRIELDTVSLLTVTTDGDTDTRGKLYDAGCNFGVLQINNDSGEGSNFLISRDLAAGAYYVEVSHNWVEGTGTYEFVSETAPSSALPNPPSVISASDGTDDQAVFLSWFPVSLASSYNIYYSETLESEQIFLKKSWGYNDSITGLTPGVVYYFWVYSENANGESATGTHNTGYIDIPDVTAPDAPSLDMALPGDGEVVLHFSANSDGGSAITGFTATCGAFDKSGSSSPITVSGLTNGVEYSCTVIATNIIGDSPPSNALWVTSRAPDPIFLDGFENQ